MSKDISVLIVDDEEALASTLAKRLSRRKIDANAVYCGQHALDCIKDKIPDVMVLDMKMPGMDGLETLKKVKATCPEIEVVILTGHADMEAAIEGIQLGAFDYLMKPVDFDALVFRIEDAHKKKVLGKC